MVSATPHSDPSGGQAPALHFLVPPSTIGLQFGTFRPGRAGIEVDWGAHFRTNDGTGRSKREPPIFLQMPGVRAKRQRSSDHD